MLGGEGGHVCFCPFLSVRFCPFSENRVPNGVGSTESSASASEEEEKENDWEEEDCGK